MNITTKLFFASVLILAAIGMSTAAQAAEPENRYILSSVDEPDQSTKFTNELELDAEWKRWDGATIGWQVLGGAAGGTGGFFLGIPLGAAIGNATTDCGNGEWGCIGPAIIGALAGATLGSWAGVHVAGELNGGDGHAGGSLLGSVLGGTLGVVLIGVSADSDTGALFAIPSAAALTIGGGIVGYHLTASAEVTGVGVAPTDGGATLGLTGRF